MIHRQGLLVLFFAILSENMQIVNRKAGGVFRNAFWRLSLILPENAAAHPADVDRTAWMQTAECPPSAAMPAFRGRGCFLLTAAERKNAPAKDRCLASGNKRRFIEKIGMLYKKIFI